MATPTTTEAAYKQGHDERNYGGVCWIDPEWSEEIKQAYKAGNDDALKGMNRAGSWTKK